MTNKKVSDQHLHFNHSPRRRADPALFTSFLLLIIVFLPLKAIGAQSNTGNLQFEGAIGSPNTKIDNPDGTSAYYDGLALQGRILIPVYAASLFSSFLTANLRYLELENTANNATQKEFSNQLGPGLGLRINFGKISLGADYYLLADRHYSFGSISKEVRQEFTPTSFYLGFSIPLGALSFGAAYIVSSGSIGTKETELTEVSPYSDTLIMFHLIWNSGLSFGKFAKDLFKL
jgi:hypothetical protein